MGVEKGLASVAQTKYVCIGAGRYRVQSNYLPALSFVIQELQARLTARFKTDDGDHYELTTLSLAICVN